MLFSRKENVFMCLVAFQKIFWKIFSGVWRRRRKRQTQTKEKTVRSRSSPPSLVNCRRCQSQSRRSHCSLIDERCDHAVNCDLPRRAVTIDDRDRRARSLDDRIAHRSTSGTIDDRCSPIWALSSLSLSLFPEMIWSENEGVKSFPDQRWKFRSIESHFLENEIYRCCQILGFRKSFSPKTNAPLEFNLSLTITTLSLVFHLVICSICCYVIGQDGVRTLSLECNPKNLGLGCVFLATFLNPLL